jgi:flagellar biosynthesis protein FliQ
MAQSYITQITREGLYLILICSAPPILGSLIIGFMISLFQATTQIQEQTLTFAPKIVVTFLILALVGPWIGGQLVRFTFDVFDRFQLLVH